MLTPLFNKIGLARVIKENHVADMASNGDMDTMLHSVISHDGLSTSQHNQNTTEMLFLGNSYQQSQLEENLKGMKY